MNSSTETNNLKKKIPTWEEDGAIAPFFEKQNNLREDPDDGRPRGEMAVNPARVAYHRQRPHRVNQALKHHPANQEETRHYSCQPTGDKALFLPTNRGQGIFPANQ